MVYIMDEMNEMNIMEEIKPVVREWIRLDNELRELKKAQQIRNKDKKMISERLITLMREINMEGFDTKDGQILYSRKNVKKPITQGQLLNILSTYYRGNEEKAVELNNFILENREEVVRESIKRVIHKSP
jgi:hypothetical protein